MVFIGVMRLLLRFHLISTTVVSKAIYIGTYISLPALYKSNGSMLDFFCKYFDVRLILRAIKMNVVFISNSIRYVKK